MGEKGYHGQKEEKGSRDQKTSLGFPRRSLGQNRGEGQFQQGRLFDKHGKVQGAGGRNSEEKEVIFSEDFEREFLCTSPDTPAKNI